MKLFSTCAKGLELLLEEELKQFGATATCVKLAGVEFHGDLEVAYRACLWSRVANHVLLPLAGFSAETPEQLYTAVKKLKWSEHLSVNHTFRIDVTGAHDHINHPHFIGQKIKDAIVDQLRTHDGLRPSIAKEKPQVVIHAHVKRTLFELSLSLSGESLHRRGYRLETGIAPLKETLAAGMLYRAGWLEECEKENPCFVDPMCGSGTLLIEAAMMAYDIAPSLSRDYFGLLGWKGHDYRLWRKLREEALARAERKRQICRATVQGYDISSRAVHTAQENIERAGFSELIQVAVQPVAQLTKPSHFPGQGLIVTNPPYGERLGEEESLTQLLNEFGRQLQQHFEGWELAVLLSEPQRLKALDIRSYKKYQLYNGALPVSLLKFRVIREYFMKH